MNNSEKKKDTLSIYILFTNIHYSKKNDRS